MHKALVRRAADVAHDARKDLVRAIDLGVGVGDVVLLACRGHDVVWRGGLAPAARREDAVRWVGALRDLDEELVDGAAEALGATNVAAQQLCWCCRWVALPEAWAGDEARMAEATLEQLRGQSRHKENMACMVSSQQPSTLLMACLPDGRRSATARALSSFMHQAASVYKTALIRTTAQRCRCNSAWLA